MESGEAFKTFYVKYQNNDGANRQYVDPYTGYAFISRDEAEEWAMENSIEDFKTYEDEEEEYLDSM